MAGDALQPAAGLQQLREELGSLKLSALEARAAAAGATEEDIEAAVDEGDPKAALIALIVRALELERAAGSGDDGAVKSLLARESHSGAVLAGALRRAACGGHAE